MTLADLTNAGLTLALGPFVVLAQADGNFGPIGSALVQFGAIGVILAWITMVDIPQRNKAAEARESQWRAQLEAERLAGERREAAFQAALAKHSAALDKMAEAHDRHASALDRVASVIGQRA